MRRLFSTRYNAGGFNTGLLVLRLGLGILMANHGYDKFIHFNTYQAHFMNFMGIGQSASLSLAIFAELFCSILVIIGLFTRLACIPLIILCCVIIFMVSNHDFFGKAETATLYLAGFLAILFTGPGRVSVDSLISK
jgi:putative oxidoreductase